MAIWAQSNPPILVSEGEQTNPADAALMADTAALRVGIWEFRISVGSSAIANFMVQRRNAANDANVGVTPIIKTAANQTGQYVFRFRLEQGERVRVVMDGALTGEAAAFINGEMLG